MGDRIMTPERIEEIKALCKTDPRALLNGSEALALEVLPVLLAELERLSKQVEALKKLNSGDWGDWRRAYLGNPGDPHARVVEIEEEG
jgi:hypothetical protein